MMCFFNFQESLHPRKLTCPLKRDYFNRKCICQPLILREHVSFPGSIALLLRHEEALQAASNAVGEARGSMPPCEMLRDCLL